ncbi:phospholipase B1, membrane-associated-like [Conger conger]|uniref:phospholipase B1, membrane-associated-like n=1 Tax=Conger conger TaxID=82655 RepID=UPI002A5AB65B|nr:phospholipase B1, membrane-associated-like [Conger conger]
MSSVSISRSEGSVANTLPNEGPTWDGDETERLLPLLCTQSSPSLDSPSSVHALRPSDIAVVSAIELPYADRSLELDLLVLDLQVEFHPSMLCMTLPDSHADLGLKEDWKLLLLLVSVDKLCSCPEQASTALSDTVQQVEETLSKLQSQLTHTLVSAVVWAGPSDDVRDAPHDRMCACEQTYNEAELRLTRTVLAQGLQESLEHHLQAKRWYSDREDFAVVLQASPIVMDMSLQPMKWDSDVKGSDIMSRPCPSEEPFLRTQRNSPSEPPAAQERSVASPPVLDSVMGTEFLCEDLSPSNSIPSSVHALRPGDIRVIAALGDSLTAGNGVGAPNGSNNILDVIREFRGLSWSIGGDEDLGNVTTLPNILRQFYPNLTGFSEGISTQDSPKAFLNQAVPGANSRDMPGQARILVDKMKNDLRIDFQNDWKVITMFIGGNDLCDFCTDSVYFSPNNIQTWIREALDILHREVPRAIVNLVEVLYIAPLRKLHQESSLQCPTWLTQALCRCVIKPKEGSVELRNMIDMNRAYQRKMQELVESGRYATHSNFTVVLQPFFRDVVLPLLEDGRPDRSYFAPDCFHLSQKSHTLMARALWNNMLEPVGNKTHTQDFTEGLSLKCPSKNEPFIRTNENSNYTYEGPAPTPPPITNWGSDFSCTDLAPSNSVPTSVHMLRPADIKVVASLGDSITAGFGAKSKNIVELKREYRGVSWSIGGDKTLNEVTTLPNILRKFNPDLNGFSTGVGAKPTDFNMAVSGAKAVDIPGQTRRLIEALKERKDVDFENDWKLVTLFIGGNDLCQYCLDRATLSPQNYSNHLRESLDLLYQEVPRTLVNILEILQINGLRRVNSDTLGCSLVQKSVCPCFLIPMEDSLELSETIRINRLYQAKSQRLVSGGRYDGREDFAVVTQPFFRNSVVPVNSDQRPDVSFFSVDCFHFSERGHSEMAIALWNNMLEPEGKKQVFNNFTTDRNKIKCPTRDQPYIFTRGNSYPSTSTTTTPTMTTATSTSTMTTLGPSAATAQPIVQNDPNSSVPAWAAALLAVIGLLIGWGVTWLILSCRARRTHKMRESATEMKGTVF